MKKLKLGILKNEVAEDHLLWQKACQELKHLVDWEVIDLTRTDWLERINRTPFDGLLASPGGYTTPFKRLYDERITILDLNYGIPIYPSPEEILIYENKKYLSYWLAANEIPHPRTWVFYYEEEALKFAVNSALPLVGKMSVGGAGSGVCILRTRDEVLKYVQNIFSGDGATLQVGPQ